MDPCLQTQHIPRRRTSDGTSPKAFFSFYLKFSTLNTGTKSKSFHFIHELKHGAEKLGRTSCWGSGCSFRSLKCFLFRHSCISVCQSCCPIMPHSWWWNGLMEMNDVILITQSWEKLGWRWFETKMFFFVFGQIHDRFKAVGLEINLFLPALNGEGVGCMGAGVGCIKSTF